MIIGKLKKIFFLNIFLFLILAQTTSAQLLNSEGTNDVRNNMVESGRGANYNVSGDLDDPLISEVMSTVITAFLSLLGIIFLVMILIGGFNWMTAAGSEDKVSKARATLVRGVIGLIITVTAYIVTAFVFRALGGIVGI